MSSNPVGSPQGTPNLSQSQQGGVGKNPTDLTGQSTPASSIAQQTLTEVTASPASTPNIKASAKMELDQNSSHYDLERLFRGRKTVITVCFSIPQPRPGTPEDDSLRAAAEQVVNVLCEDLEPKLSSSENKIDPNASLNIVFDDEGYHVAVTKPNQTSSLDEVLASPIKGDTPQSKAISKAIGQRTAEAIHAELDTNPELKQLRDRVTQKQTQAAANSPPVNLVHNNNNCYINTAFVLLVNHIDPNVGQALRNPNNHLLGEESPLYKAVRAYDRHQAQGLSGKCDVGRILGLEDRFQGDSLLDAMKQFRGFLNNDDQLPQCLQDALKQPDPHTIKAGCSLEEFAQIAVGNPATATDFPTSFSVYSPRVTHDLGGKKLSEILDSSKTDKAEEEDEEEDEAEEISGNLKPFSDSLVEGIQSIKDTNSKKRALLQQTFSQKFPDTDFSLEDFVLEETDYTKMLEHINAEIDKTAGSQQQHLKGARNALNQYYYLNKLPQINVSSASEEEDGDGDEGLTLDDLLDNAPRDTATIKAILDDAKALEWAWRFIDEKTKQMIRNKRAEAFQAKKVTTPVAVNENGQVTISAQDGSEQVYDLVAVQAHGGNSPNSGHNVAYLRNRIGRWCLDDIHDAADRVEPSQFLDAARNQGFFYTFVKKGTLDATTGIKGSQSDPQKEQEPPSVKFDKDAETINADSTIQVGRGSLKGLTGFTCVNPVMVTKGEMHPQINEALGTQARDVRTSLLSRSYFTKGQPWLGFSPRNWGIGAGIIHTDTGMPLINIAIEPLKNLKDIRHAVLDVLNSARDHKPPITKIAFPVFECGRQGEDQVINEMRKAIEEFDKTYSKKGWSAEYRIIRPTSSTAPATRSTIKPPSKTSTPSVKPIIVNQHPVTIQTATHHQYTYRYPALDSQTSADDKTQVTNRQPARFAQALNLGQDTVAEVLLNLTTDDENGVSNTSPFGVAKYVRNLDGTLDTEALVKLISGAQGGAPKCSITIKCFADEKQAIDQALREAQSTTPT